MDAALRQVSLVRQANGKIGGIDRQQGIVIANRRIQQQRLSAPQMEGKPRKVAGLTVEKAELHRSNGLDVAKTVEDREGLAIFEDTSAVISERGRRFYVELVIDCKKVVSSFESRHDRGTIVSMGCAW